MKESYHDAHRINFFKTGASLLDMRPYLNLKSAWVAGRAQGKYEQLIGRFFRENGQMVKSELRAASLHEYDYFLKLMASVESDYYCD